MGGVQGPQPIAVEAALGHNSLVLCFTGQHKRHPCLGPSAADLLALP